MDERAVVTCFLRHGTEVLLIRRSDAVGSYAGLWGGVSGYAEGTPDEAARWEVDEEVGVLEEVERVRAGDPVPVEDDDRGTRWLVHPYLFECRSGRQERRGGETPPPGVEPNEEIADWEWVQPPAMLDRETVPKLWEAYLAVAPTVETVREDTEHGAAYISLRALETLRDRAAGIAAEGGEGDGYREIVSLASELREARPSMGVLATRIDRVMSEAGETPAAVRDRAIEACDRAVEADRKAAERAAKRVDDSVLTLSRSGTVLEALRLADPRVVYVAESRPAREGVGVAEELAATTDADVRLCVDAAVGSVLEREPVDTVLVGVDTVCADGVVVNKVGTRLAALAAADLGIDCYAVCARDKIIPDSEPELEDGPTEEVYDGDADVRVVNPTFEATSLRLFDGLITEDGSLDAAAVETVASEHAALAEWHADAP